MLDPQVSHYLTPGKTDWGAGKLSKSKRSLIIGVTAELDVSDVRYLAQFQNQIVVKVIGSKIEAEFRTVWPLQNLVVDGWAKRLAAFTNADVAYRSLYHSQTCRPTVVVQNACATHGGSEVTALRLRRWSCVRLRPNALGVVSATGLYHICHSLTKRVTGRDFEDLALTLTFDPENLFSHAHSHDEHLCQVLSSSLH